MRAGDVVYHWPTGGQWVLAYAASEHVAWCGWPSGEARADECILMVPATEREHRETVMECARMNSGDKRKTRNLDYARRMGWME